MNIKIIKDKFPSLCYNCIYGRAVADSNILKGYVGCVAKFDEFPIGNPSEEDISYIYKAKEIATGWIYHKRHIKSNKDKSLNSGIMANGQIITKEVNSCNYFKEDK